MIEAGLYAKIITDQGNVIVKLEYKKARCAVAYFVAFVELYKEASFFVFPKSGLGITKVIDMSYTYYFPDEFHPDFKKNPEGTLFLHRDGWGCSCGNFFVTRKTCPCFNSRYLPFGRVCDLSRLLNSNKIDHIEILRVGEEAENFQATYHSFLRERFTLSIFNDRTRESSSFSNR